MRTGCHALAREARRQINELTGLPALCPDSSEWFSQMAAVRLPPVDVETLKTRLYDDHRIEVPVFKWNDQPILRFSFQGYNSAADVEALVGALKAIWS